MRKIIEDKKGQSAMSLLIIAGLIILLMFVGLMVMIGSGITTFTVETINDVTSDLGVIDIGGDGANISEYNDYTIGTLNESVQMLKFGSGIVLVFAILGIIVFASSIRFNPSLSMIGFYLLLVFCVLMISIFMSNIYEDFLDDSGDIGQELQKMTMGSFILLYMPHIITVISFIGGIIIFSGIGEEIV